MLTAIHPASMQPEGNQVDGGRPGEQGYMLLAIIVMVSLVLIALAVAAPVVARDIRRDKEVESEHRAQQYVRALRLFYRKTRTYPGSLEALEKSNNVRFLRKQYVDPLTGKADWRIIHVGENQTTVKGFFGESLGGLDTKGIGSGVGSAMSPGLGGTSTIGQTSGLAAGFSGATVAAPTSNPGTGSPSASGSTPGVGGTPAFGAPAGSTAGAGTAGSTGSPGFGSGGVGQVMGIGSSRSGSSILTPNQQTSYDTWEFLYDPRIERLYAKASILGGIGSGGMNSGGMDSKSPSNSINGSPTPGTTTPGSIAPPPGTSTPFPPTRP